MISLVKLIISGIHKIFFLLRSTVITVCHHQVPMYIFDNSVSCRSKRILALSNVADDTGISTTLFLYFTECRFFILFAKLQCPGTPLQLLQSLSAEPILRNDFCNSCTKAISCLCVSPHRHNWLLLSLHFLLRAVTFLAYSILSFYHKCNANHYFERYSRNIFFAIGTAYFPPVPAPSTTILTTNFG